MWPALPKPATYTHYSKEQFSSPMDSPINKLTTYLPVHHCRTLMGSAFAEACFWGLSDIHECLGVHWMPLVILYRQPPCWKSPHNWLMIYVGHGFSYVHVVTVWVQWVLLVGHFTLKIKLHCCLPLCGSPPPPTLHSCISACGVDKNYLKWLENQLAIHCREDSLIDLENSYSYVANCKPAALGLLEIIHFEIFNYIFLDNYFCAYPAGFPKASHIW